VPLEREPPRRPRPRRRSLARCRGSLPAMHRATTVRHPAMRHLDLSGDLFGAVSGGLRAGCGLLSTGRSGLGCGGSLHWAELAVASQNLVRANGRRKERTCDRWPACEQWARQIQLGRDRNHCLKNAHLASGAPGPPENWSRRGSDASFGDFSLFALWAVDLACRWASAPVERSVLRPAAQIRGLAFGPPSSPEYQEGQFVVLSAVSSGS
jgi:hypothetical protein